MYKVVQNNLANSVMVIADGAAFGPEMESIVSLYKEYRDKITLFFPESFEWLVLKSGLIHDVNKILEHPEEFIESSEYFSWERFFAELLIAKTEGTYLTYNKKKLNENYLQKHEMSEITKNIPFFKGK